MDAYSRLIVGWSIADHMCTELVVDALGMATLRRRPESDSMILNSDHGTQGDCYDNSMMESFGGTLQLEVFDTRTWETRDELANVIFE